MSATSSRSASKASASSGRRSSRREVAVILRMRVIQYAAAPEIERNRRGVLDHPLSRMMAVRTHVQLGPRPRHSQEMPRMKLTFSAASPFARKVRIAAIELGLIDKIELTPATVAPGQPNDDYSRITPLKKLPVLILDNGEVILDSYVIVEYLDELAGGGKLIPASGPLRWTIKSDHSLLQGMLDSMLLCRYENMVRPEALRWKAWSDDHWNRAWLGMARFEGQVDTMMTHPLDIAQ